MPKKLQISLQRCLSKIKNPNPSSKKWILSRCNHPKTPSFAMNRGSRNNDDGHEGPAATLADVDRFLLENFKSLYIKNDEDGEDISHQNKEAEEIEQEDDCQRYQVKSPGGFLFDSPRFIIPPPRLCGSHRFFVAAGSSSSLIEEARTSLTTTTTTTTTSTSDEGGSRSRSTSPRSCSNNNTDITNVNSALPEDEYVAVKTYSRSPSKDFRRSMQEMVEARVQEYGNVDWDFMQELLFCYLNLNEKKSHKFILSAFVDLIVGLRQRGDKVPARSRRSSPRRERRRKLRNVT